MVVFLLFLALFIGCCLINFYAIHHRETGANQKIAFWSKAFLMPLLLMSYLGFVHFKPSLFVVLALVFGFLGDVILEFGDHWFIPGLVSFLLGHVFWILSFTKSMQASSWMLWLCLVPLLLYGLILFKRLMTSTDAAKLKIPLVLYMLILVCLCQASVLRTKASLLPYLAGLFGSFLFMVSDSLLAVWIYLGGKERGIMLTYTAAQLLLMLSQIL